MGKRYLLGVAAGLCLAGPALAEGPLYVQVGGGDWATANIAAYVEPFEKETGIDVEPVRDFMPLSKLKLMVENDNIEVDVADVPWPDYNVAVQNGWLEPIDYAIYKPGELAGLVGNAQKPYGVAAMYAAYVLAWRTDVFTAGVARPTDWVEFWDCQAFPGERTLRGGFYGSGPWEEALLADGVSVDQLYPMDIDRVFASLDRLKPCVTKWWKEGSEGQQLLADGVVDLAHVFNARATNLIRSGSPVAIEWNQAKLQIDFWVIPKGSKNVEAAQQFIEFATRAENQAKWAELFPYGPSNQNAFQHLSAETAAILPTAPENWAKVIVRNDDWYAEKDASGKTNLERLVERWNEWIVE